MVRWMETIRSAIRENRWVEFYKQHRSL